MRMRLGPSPGADTRKPRLPRCRSPWPSIQVAARKRVSASHSASVSLGALAQDLVCLGPSLFLAAVKRRWILLRAKVASLAEVLLVDGKDTSVGDGPIGPFADDALQPRNDLRLRGRRAQAELHQGLLAEAFDAGLAGVSAGCLQP